MTPRSFRKLLGGARRKLCESVGIARYSRPTLNGLDRKLEKYLDYRNGFFIEAGANDGYSQSNTYYLEKLKGWSGILVEPIPDLYKKCKKLRTRSICVNCALVSGDCLKETVEMHYAGLMSLVDGALKDKEAEMKHIEQGLKCQGIKKSYALCVPTRTLGSILDEYNIRSIDLLSLDVEGWELEVLKGLDLNRWRPQYMCIEARFRREIEEYIAPYYEIVEELTDMDVLYKATK